MSNSPVLLLIKDLVEKATYEGRRKIELSTDEATQLLRETSPPRGGPFNTKFDHGDHEQKGQCYDCESIATVRTFHRGTEHSFTYGAHDLCRICADTPEPRNWKEKNQKHLLCSLANAIINEVKKSKLESPFRP